MLLDTTVLVDLSRGDKPTALWLEQASEDKTIFISAISIMELVFGVRDKRELEALNQMVNLLEPLKITEEITDIAVGLMKTHILTHRLSIPDALIAATALVHSLPLATSNKKHFEMIPHLRIVVPVN